MTTATCNIAHEEMAFRSPKLSSFVLVQRQVFGVWQAVSSCLILLHRLHLTSTRLHYTAVEDIYLWINIQQH